MPGLLKRLATAARSAFDSLIASERGGDQEFRTQILHEAGDWIARRTGLAREDVVQELENGPDAPQAELGEVLRVEYDIVKESADSIKRTVLIATDEAGGPRISRIERRLRWDDLPADIRSSLIRRPTQQHTYLVYQRPDSEGAQGKK